MTPQDFISKWRSGGDERRDAQPFFEDLCRLVRHKTPREADPEHTWFTYEYGAAKTSGGDGWADVWKKGFFGWEAKGTHKSLEKAYQQLKMYADALQNPPLLVVSDLRTIEVHTNFTNTVKRVYRFTVDQLAEFEHRQVLDAVFHAPDRLRPGTTCAAVTKQAADKFTELATALRDRGHAPREVAHFLNRVLFCMFAEDIKLLPDMIFTKLVERSQHDPDAFERRCRELFNAMHRGGEMAFETIEWFNGGLFDDGAVLRLQQAELKLLHGACILDWSEIEPSIFGTLFERGLDPSKRSQLGAHYTDPETILKIVRPVVIEPWLADWEAEKAELQRLLAKAGLKESSSRDTAAQKAAKTKALSAAQNRLNAFLERLRHFTVLDPACGSGNFLYLSLRALKDIEKRVLIEAEGLGLGRQFPMVGPASVKGIEVNTYAAELARVTIWIGEIQWMIQNGYGARKDPILRPLDQIENRDALLNPDGSAAAWPAVDAIVGNPPFVGDKKMIGELGEEYATILRKAYSSLVPGGADLVCYWFEKARAAISCGRAKCAGLVATNSIRGGANRKVLERIAESPGIFDAWSDQRWINDGAGVRVSLVCFGKTVAQTRIDGKIVHRIHADLEAASEINDTFNVVNSLKMLENSDISFIGIQKSGPFDLAGDMARKWLKFPNPNGNPNSDVIKPWANGMDLTRRASDSWIIDFGIDMGELDAAMYELPYAHVKQHVKPMRENVRRDGHRNYWWRHGETRPGMRSSLNQKSRYIAAPRVAKHRLFVWLPQTTVPDCQIVVFARDDETSFGVLHSRIHEAWSLRMGTSLEDRPRYTPTTCFETFPFPAGLAPNIPAADYAADPRAVRIADAARKLVEARDRWLNPPEWTQRVPEVVGGYPDRILPKPGFEAELKKRTLTNLYNARPAWLDHLHRELDAAVAAAYGWEWPLPDDEILRRLFELNQQRAAGPALPGRQPPEASQAAAGNRDTADAGAA